MTCVNDLPFVNGLNVSGTCKAHASSETDAQWKWEEWVTRVLWTEFGRQGRQGGTG